MLCKFVVALLVLCFSINSRADSPARAETTEGVYQAVIVGGGIAGLTAAFQFSKKNILLLEKWPRVGGRVWDDYYKGFSYSRGAEYLGEPDGMLKKVMKKYKLTPIEIITPVILTYNPVVSGYPNTKIWNEYDGIALMHVMEDGGDKKALKTYNRFQRETTALVDETYDAGELPHAFDLTHPVAQYDYMTMREWFNERGFGRTYQDKWNSHARGLYGANMDEVSILMAISELGWEYYEEEDIEMPDDSWNEYLIDQWPSETFTFLHGISELSQGIANDPNLQGKIRTNAVVTSVTQSGSIYTIKYQDRITGEEFTVQSNAVVMAVPANTALQIAPDLITGETRQIMEGIQYCEYLTVNLFSEEPIYNLSFELSTPDYFSVISFYDSLWVQKMANPDNPANSSTFVTTAYIAGRKCADKLVRLSDADILNMTYRDLDEIFPGASSKVLDAQINRFTHGYPLVDLGAYHRLVRLNQLNVATKPLTFALVGDYLALPTVEAAMDQAGFVAKKMKLK